MPASSSSSITRFLEETTGPGIIESGGPQVYRLISGGLSQTTESSEDNELRSDRGRGDSTLVSGSVNGNLEIAYSHKTHDEFLEGLLADTFVEAGTDGETDLTDAVFDATAHTLASAGSGLPVIAPGQWFQISGANLAANDGIYKATTSETHDADLITVDTAVKNFTDDTTNTASISSSRLSQGNDPLRTWTVERELSDVVPTQFFTWAGCYVSSLSLEYSITEKLMGSFGFLGSENEDTTNTTSNFPGIASAVAATTTGFMNSVTGTHVLLDGLDMGTSCAESLSVSIEANLRERRCMGSGGLAASSIGSDAFKISFTANVYFGTSASAALYAKKITDEALSFSVCLSDSDGNGFAVSFPRCKITSAEVDSGGLGSDVMLSLSADAVTDPTDGTMLHIDRLGTVA